MKKLKRLSVLLVLALPLAFAAPAPAAHPPHGWDVHCGNRAPSGAGWFNLRGYNVACSVARKTANKYVFQGEPRPNGWRCRDEQIGDELWRTNCTRSKAGEHQHIRFLYGA